jgi:hypothetical protein
MSSRQRRAGVSKTKTDDVMQAINESKEGDEGNSDGEGDEKKGEGDDEGEEGEGEGDDKKGEGGENSKPPKRLLPQDQ